MSSTIEAADKSSRKERCFSPYVFSEKEQVSAPPHYTSGAIECIDAMQAMMTDDEFIGFLRGNVFKYQWRYRDKNGVEDLEKMQWYLHKLIEVEIKNETK